jgi:hypothetical protein
MREAEPISAPIPAPTLPRMAAAATIPPGPAPAGQKPERLSADAAKPNANPVPAPMASLSSAP